MNYYDTFIQIAPDSTATHAITPPQRGESKSIPAIEHELLSAKPYHYTQEELLFTVHLLREGVPLKLPGAKREKLWQQYFSKSRACLRTSSLPRKYGWGFHFDKAGKIALVPINSPDYEKFASADDLDVIPAMRSNAPDRRGCRAQAHSSRK